MKISACIITKNEEHNLPRLLNSIKEKFDEIILVDTGSTDRTVEIAKEYGCKVYEKRWNGFANARNYAVSKASGDWIWHFDADFELEDKEFERFKNIISMIGNDDTFDGISVTYKNLNEIGEIKSISSTVHIHRNSKDIKWIGKVHERIHNLKKDIVVTPPYTVFVKHYGYAVASVQKEKAERNLNLLFEDIKGLDKYSDEYLIKLFYIIQSYLALSAFKKEYLEKIVKYSKEFFEIFEKIKSETSLKESIFYKHTFVYISTALYKLEQISECEKYIEDGLKKFPEYPDLLYMKGLILEYKGKEEYLEEFLKFIYVSEKLSTDIKKFSAFVSDYISEIDSLILDKFVNIHNEKLMDIAKEYWKETKGEKIALIYYFLTRNLNQKKSFSLLKKFIKMYDTDIFYIEYANYFEETEEKIKILQQGLQKNPNSKFINKYLGNLYFENKDHEKAFKYLKNYLELSKDSSILPIIKDIIEKLGYKKEAELLLQKL